MNGKETGVINLINGLNLLKKYVNGAIRMMEYFGCLLINLSKNMKTFSSTLSIKITFTQVIG